MHEAASDLDILGTEFTVNRKRNDTSEDRLISSSMQIRYACYGERRQPRCISITVAAQRRRQRKASIHQPRTPTTVKQGSARRRAQMVVSYAMGTTFSGLLSFELTVRASRGITGCLFKCRCSPLSFALRFLAALSFTRTMNSSREREWRTCSTRTLMRFSM